MNMSKQQRLDFVDTCFWWRHPSADNRYMPYWKRRVVTAPCRRVISDNGSYLLQTPESVFKAPQLSELSPAVSFSFRLTPNSLPRTTACIRRPPTGVIIGQRCVEITVHQTYRAVVSDYSEHTWATVANKASIVIQLYEQRDITGEIAWQ